VHRLSLRRQGGGYPAFGADAVARCEPVYQDFAGWSQSTHGVRAWSDLPVGARNYLNRLSELAEVRST